MDTAYEKYHEYVQPENIPNFSDNADIAWF